ncbi:conserved protein of unknown function [Acidithiobacillus ferrivorans]|uniref:Uncharacterized protein n=1 Tax=Acidithiobacillus ferrivorans TaxID=160808 RepID=A0A060URJ4_9PROT|nr:hypothetical protein [Acidithiobacillus ferrivorans]CDQ09194.1 conserved hypothetical protein [Acidithiobacillus ferrivorans]SMH64863.1 conserved protein of unknown function [Acidithiobacillus ferrivorans]
MNTEKPRIVIIMEGGVITALLSNMPIDVAVIDYDTEGAETEDLKFVPQGPVLPPSAAVAHVEDAEVIGTERLEELFSAASG